ncbi:MAG: malonyl-[acyl-carrier protein] O-methyltransferase BioC, partial [Fusobacterium sp.]
DREDFPRVSLILSSSVFQWSKNFEELVKNISKSCRHLVFSIYLEDNLPEIKKHFSISLNYMTAEEIENILKKYFKKIKKESEIFIENFNSPIEVLRHLKNTGVTGFEKTEIKKIRSFSSAELTYKVGYFLCEK